MFRGYDIRGVYGKEVTDGRFTALGVALNSFSKKFVVGMDFRQPNPALFKALSQGYSGELLFMGNAPTAAVSFNSKEYGLSITASHNPAGYAGAKFIHERHGFFEAELERLKKKFEECDGKAVPKNAGGAKVIESKELLDAYADAIPEISKGIFDLGGGAACAVKKIFPKGKTIFDTPDPLFERRAPEPKDETLGELKKKTVSEGQLGFAFDGDADRVMVASEGKVISGPIVTAFLCQQNFKKNDKVVLNIEFSQESKQFIEDELGMKVAVCPVGTKHVVTNVLKHGAALGAEPNGHYYIPRHVPDSDGIYSAALLSTASPRELTKFAKQFKHTVLSEAVKGRADFKKIESAIRQIANQVNTMDGVWAAFDDGYVLIRASNTEPKIRVTCEADSRGKAEKAMRMARKLVENFLVK